MARPHDLRDGVALITGAASGIGAALADSLARRRAHLALVDIDAARLEEVAARARAHGVRVSAHVLDVADAAAVAALPQAVLAGHGRGSGLINNAGVAVGGTFEQVDAADFDWLMSINFFGTVRMTRAFLPILAREPVARLVNVSSIVGIIAPPGQTAYCASKYAVRGFSESLRHELEAAGSPVGVTVVHPGGVRTRIAEQARAPKGAPPDEVARQQAMWRRLLTLAPEQAAERIVTAIERGERRVLVGRDAQQAAWIERLLPVGYWTPIARGLARREGNAGAPACSSTDPTTKRSNMASWQARVAAFIVRRRVKPALGDMSDIARVRKAFGTRLPAPGGVRYTPATLGGVAGEWVEPAAPAGALAAASFTLLYIHGGGFVGCSPLTHRPVTAALARHGARVFVPDYRLAPEHPFPAGLDDVRAVWAALAHEHAGAERRAPADDDERGEKAEAERERPGAFGEPRVRRLAVAGESAGANLALALMLALRDGGGRLPDAAALFSPPVDLTGSSPSLLANSERDAMFSGEGLAHLADAYLAGADPAQPLVSPLFGELAGLPPLLIHVGADEVLRDDALRLAEQARAAGVPVELEVFPVVPHAWQLLWRVPEAKRSVAAAVRFLREAHGDGSKAAAVPAPSASAARVAATPLTATAAAAATAAATPAACAPAAAEVGIEPRFDVIIVGAGLSGIGAAAHLQDECPGKRYAILEARAAIGGTWDLFRYPGVRSDSDMHTLGYAFKPWTHAKAIADGPSIRAYIEETAAERGIDRHIRFGERVLRAEWSSADACWRVEVQAGDARRHYAANFLLFCSGYYDYAQGHRPAFAGEERYRGTRVHPQFWPSGLEHAGRRIVVIGSGATAVTLVPELAKTAAHVTMLQRSPSYYLALPSRDGVAEALRRRLPERLAYRLVRAKNVLLTMLFFQASRRWPERMKERLVGAVQRRLGAGHDVATDFTPRYDPWDQRLCVLPDADLFKAIRSGRASVVTDRIDSFTEHGVRLASGRELEADIVVTATGLKLNALGNVQLVVDGRPVRAADTVAYKGTMFSGVPNLAYTFGYTNASWTLKADLIAGWVCRLLDHMERRGLAVAVPLPDPSVATRPFLELTSGYVQRGQDILPRQGTRKPWRLYQNYLLDLWTLRFGRLDDGTLKFSKRPEANAPAVERAVETAEAG
jgi:cation diffusion facilitator CzcD-associated flavoprotein CzcO/acetyl esterase/lipase/short-subunit dehydrogenase